MRVQLWAPAHGSISAEMRYSGLPETNGAAAVLRVRIGAGGLKAWHCHGPCVLIWCGLTRVDFQDDFHPGLARKLQFGRQLVGKFFGIKDIAQALNLSARQVKRWAKRVGVPPTIEGYAPHRWSQADFERLVKEIKAYGKEHKRQQTSYAPSTLKPRPPARTHWNPTPTPTPATHSGPCKPPGRCPLPCPPSGC